MLTSQELTEIKNRLERGVTMTKIAKEYGLSARSMTDRLSRCGYRYTGTLVPLAPVPLVDSASASVK